MQQSGAKPPARGGGRFRTTRWSLVGEAGREGQDALEALCGIYWPPIYAFIRRSGSSSDAAQDLTQEFFARILEKGTLKAADSKRGKFRTFLLTSLKNFLANERSRASSLKRGGPSVRHIEIDDAEVQYQLRSTERCTPESAFLRSWAQALIDRVLNRLEREADETGSLLRFQLLKPSLTGESPQSPYKQVGQRLGLSEAAVKVAVHRLRRRFGQLLRDEVAQTLQRSEELEPEIRFLLASIES